MATGFNTQVGNGKYRLQFETGNEEYYLMMQKTARRCVDGEPVTNADRIRSMSDEELANVIARNAYTGACNDFGISYDGKCCHNCEKCDAIIKWLQQPAEGE